MQDVIMLGRNNLEIDEGTAQNFIGGGGLVSDLKRAGTTLRRTKVSMSCTLSGYGLKSYIARKVNCQSQHVQPLLKFAREPLDDPDEDWVVAWD